MNNNYLPECSSSDPKNSSNGKKWRIISKWKTGDNRYLCSDGHKFFVAQNPPINSNSEKPSEHQKDIALINFLCYNGISTSCVEEETFKTFMNTLQPTSQIFKKSDLHHIMHLMSQNSGSCKVYYSDEPIAITYDVQNKGEEAYLVFSITGYIGTERKTHVFMRKLMACETIPESIMKIIKSSFTRNKSFEQKDFVITPSKIVANNFQSFACFHTSLTNFAEQVLSLPTFQERLSILKNFVTILKTNLNTFEAFKSFMAGECPDLPIWRGNDWISVCDFLRDALKLHKIFNDFNEANSFGIYLSPEMHEKLLFLQRLLANLKKCAKEISMDTNGVGKVVPIVISIRSHIQMLSNLFISVPREVFENVQKIFEKNIVNVTLSRVDLYLFATFLDIRYVHSEHIFDQKSWKCIEDRLTNDIVDDILPNHLTIFDRIHEKKIIELEIKVYKSYVTNYQKSDQTEMENSVWWAEHKEVLPNLSTKWKSISVVPAVSIDSNYYFGKYERFCENAKHSKDLEKLLNIAAKLEKFVGRGSFRNDAMENECAMRRLIEYERVRYFEKPIHYRPVRGTSQRFQSTTKVRNEVRIEDYLMEEPPEKMIKIEHVE